MADDIFSQLLNLFNQPGPVNWKLAKEIAGQLSGDRQPVDPWLADEYIELGRLSQLQIDAATPLSAPDSLDVVPTDRREWVTQQLQAFDYLVEPLSSSYGDIGGSDPMSQMLKPLGPALLGMQMGSTIGFMAHRTIGQFEIGLPTHQPGPRYVIVENVEAFIADNNLDDRQVRLWVSFRNGIHDAAFSGPWLRQHVVDLVEAHVATIEFDTSSLMESLQGLSDPSQFQELMAGSSGLTNMMSNGGSEAGDDARAAIGFVSGYADFVLDQVGANLLPALNAIRSAHSLKEAEPTAGEQLIHRMLGLELTGELHAAGATFCAEVERRWGIEALNSIWAESEHLPKGDELTDPVAWAARVLLPEF